MGYRNAKKTDSPIPFQFDLVELKDHAKWKRVFTYRYQVGAQRSRQNPLKIVEE